MIRSIILSDHQIVDMRRYRFHLDQLLNCCTTVSYTIVLRFYGLSVILPYLLINPRKKFNIGQVYVGWVNLRLIYSQRNECVTTLIIMSRQDLRSRNSLDCHCGGINQTKQFIQMGTYRMPTLTSVFSMTLGTFRLQTTFLLPQSSYMKIRGPKMDFSVHDKFEGSKTIFQI